MDDATETILPKCMCLQSIKRVTDIGIGEYLHPELKTYMDDATETILPICKCLQGIMTETKTGTEKQQKVSVAYHKVK